MKNIFKAISDWKKEMKMNRETKHMNEIRKQCYDSIQVMEFNGDLYISHDGVPIVKLNDLKENHPSSLATMREDCVKYIAGRENLMVV